MIYAISIYDLMQKVGYGWAVYSPSRGAVYDFSGFNRPRTVSETDLFNPGLCGSVFGKMDAFTRVGIAVANGWSDAVVKLIYRTDALTNENRWISDGSKLDNLTLIPNKQSFAQWLIDNNYAQIVAPGGDM